MGLLSVVYVSGFIARHVLRAVRCDTCITCLISLVILSTIAYIYFKEYKDDEQSLTYPSDRQVQIVISSVIVMEDMMADVAYTHSLKEKI